MKLIITQFPASLYYFLSLRHSYSFRHSVLNWCQPTCIYIFPHVIILVSHLYKTTHNIIIPNMNTQILNWKEESTSRTLFFLSLIHETNLNLWLLIPKVHLHCNLSKTLSESFTVGPRQQSNSLFLLPHNSGGYVTHVFFFVNCWWSSPAQWRFYLNPTGLNNIYYCLTTLGDFRPSFSQNCLWIYSKIYTNSIRTLQDQSFRAILGNKSCLFIVLAVCRIFLR
jgi:hypothetical protein